jgi:acetate---CoA ligase (ADP-forming)
VNRARPGTPGRRTGSPNSQVRNDRDRTPTPYPSGREACVALRDGSTVRLRPIRRDDAGRLLAFLRGLSEESLTSRFFSPATDLPAEARRETDVDEPDIVALVATAGPDERIIGHGLYATTGPARAEVALTVADEYQGCGLGTFLLGQLADLAAANGVAIFEAEVLPTNGRALGLLRRFGYPLEVRDDFGALRLTFPTARTERRPAASAAAPLRHPRH